MGRVAFVECNFADAGVTARVPPIGATSASDESPPVAVATLDVPPEPIAIGAAEVTTAVCARARIRVASIESKGSTQSSTGLIVGCMRE